MGEQLRTKVTFGLRVGEVIYHSGGDVCWCSSGSVYLPGCDKSAAILGPVLALCAVMSTMNSGILGLGAQRKLIYYLGMLL